MALNSLLYRRSRFHPFGPGRPKLVFHPKYEVRFDTSLENLRKALSEMGFAPITDDQLVYGRGKWWGDLSIRSAKIRAEIDAAQGTFKLYAPYLGMFFDTGDLWGVADEILKNSTKG